MSKLNKIKFFNNHDNIYCTISVDACNAGTSGVDARDNLPALTMDDYKCYCTSASDCAWGTSAPAEVCTDTIDNDCGGGIDCSDPACAGGPPCCGGYEQDCCPGSSCEGAMYCSSGYYDSSRNWVNQDDKCCDIGEYYRDGVGCWTHDPCSPVCWDVSCISGGNACCSIFQYGEWTTDDNFPVTTY